MLGWAIMKVLGHPNTWPEEVLERSNSSLVDVLAQVFERPLER